MSEHGKGALYAFGQPCPALGPHGVLVCAMADDGTVLGQHACSSVGFAYGDLDLAPISEEPLRGEHDKRRRYLAHFPDGYEVVNLLRLTDAELDLHEGFLRAFALNQKQKAEPPAVSPDAATNAAQLARAFPLPLTGDEGRED